ncbi:MAG: quinone oxidoreductase [Acidobacteria bacterium RIFCSPLOWO2_02_FULL_68_18]|nr:MAG: quinone oxidoreductase [Acidobacteria bacterium RIFCSPLOWO2_02_FULL_68_18]OFW50726.1 MAG: quinone oxidoreductase [Acidobacteria bacterium RIFCSPLOWO2_12_FULL_68_19]
MRAIVVREWGPPDVMKLEEAPIPSPGPGQVLARLRAVGVNPVETYVRAGTYVRKPSLPYTPGGDAAGVVGAIGAGVTGVEVGDRVYTHGTLTGAYAEAALCEAAQIHPLPGRVSFAQGAALGTPYSTAWRALFIQAHARPAETVLVHGASGGVGTACVQLARAAGLRVIGTAGTEKGMQLVGEQGAHDVLNHRDPEYLTRIGPLTGGRGVDLVVEMLANVNLDRDLDLLAPRGRVIVVGNRGRVEIDPRKIMSRDAAILAMTMFNATPEEYRVIHAALAPGLENGTLVPVVGRELPLASAPQAHTAVLEPGAYGKIVLVP